jgi:endoglucanase
MHLDLSGFETGCDTTGTCNFNSFSSPLTAAYNITGQITHFVNDDGFNSFRIPVSWQYLTSNTGTTTGTLNAANFAAYDQ